MKQTGLTTTLILFSLCLFGQSAFITTYQQLREYEGNYEYINSSHLSIAASPKDTLLYAIINKSSYPLRPVALDEFLNASKEIVRFYRNSSKTIAGYITGKDSFQILDRKVNFPQTMWYPRMDPSYRYQVPVDIKDGLATGSVSGTGLDTGLLNTMVRKIAEGMYPNVHSILIISNGKLVFEEYFYEYNKDSLQEMRSVTKSFISALTGIAINKGYMKSTNEKVLSFFPEYSLDHMSPLKEKITIGHLLTNQSGLDCDVSNDQSAGNETKMGYSADWVKYTLDLPMIDTPGGKGMYCSGNPVTLGRIIEKATKQPLVKFAEQNLFNPLHINHYRWNFRADQTNAEDFCQLYLTPREMAKFGLLYLDHGNWEGQQLIPANWVKQSFEKHSVVQGVNYGYLWWLKYLDAEGTRYYGIAAQGNGGQKIYIWPAINLVTVITGGNYNSQSPSDELIRKYILPAFNKR